MTHPATHPAVDPMDIPAFVRRPPAKPADAAGDMRRIRLLLGMAIATDDPDRLLENAILAEEIACKALRPTHAQGTHEP